MCMCVIHTYVGHKYPYFYTYILYARHVTHSFRKFKNYVYLLNSEIRWVIIDPT